MSLDVRSARFLRAVESDRWYHGRPEQTWVGVQEHQSTLLLQLAKGLRVTGGLTKRGIKKPHRFKQTTRALCYNLADKEHLKAFLTTFSRLTAMAAALEGSNTKGKMSYGERRVLGRTELRLRDTMDGVAGTGSEILELHCENANYRKPSNKLFARNAAIRAEAWRRRLRQCHPRKQYTFYIRRVVNDHRGMIVNECTEIGIPLEAVKRLARMVEDVLRESWSYLLRYPSQVERRYDHPDRARWQLHHPPAFDWLMPRLQTALLYQQESALFKQPELYSPVPRLLGEGAEAVEDFHPRYVRRLLAYGDGELLWRGHWTVSEFEAWDDLVLLRRLLWRGVQQKLLEITLTCLVLWTLRKERLQNPANFGAVVRYEDCCSRESAVGWWARGPPE